MHDPDARAVAPPGGAARSVGAEVWPVCAADGARSELLVVRPAAAPALAPMLYWLPAMGVPAKHYLPLAQALAGHGIGMALHEWRGIGSSDRRAHRRSDWNYRTLLCEDLPAGIAVLRAQAPSAPWFLGGHSLGGQLACLAAALERERPRGLALVASGAPYWRHFDRRWLIRLAYLGAPVVARLVGHLPGRRLGFGGNEARGVIADWARSGRTGRYAARGLQVDLERALAELALPVLGVRLRDDWLGPAASLDWLLGKMPRAPRSVRVIAPPDLGGVPADHFAWMKAPDAVAAPLSGWIADVEAAPRA